MTPALRWAAMRTILMGQFINCEGQSQELPDWRTTFEEKGEPKRIRTEVTLLTGPNALPLDQTGSHDVEYYLREKNYYYYS